MMQVSDRDQWRWLKFSMMDIDAAISLTMEDDGQLAMTTMEDDDGNEDNGKDDEGHEDGEELWDFVEHNIEE